MREGQPVLLLLAAERVSACLAAWGMQGEILATCKGHALERQAFAHPFADRLAPVFLGEYVTLDTGTGIVHSSPAYGVEDFLSCKRYGMKDDDILNPVMGDGRYASWLEPWAGLSIWEANPKIVDTLRERGALLKVDPAVAASHPCGKLVTRGGNRWALTTKGSQLVDVLSY